MPPDRRDRLVIVCSIAAIVLAAWIYLVHLGRQMAYDTAMAEMGMAMDARWTPSDVFFAFVMWSIMMAGMMSAAALPMLLSFAAARAGRDTGGGRAPVTMFAAGYFAVWIGFSAVAAIAQWRLHETALLSPAMAASSPFLRGAIFVAAGLYQLTPWKGACLRQCRNPLGFLLTNWRVGRFGAFRMGIDHGLYCLGCCWALMCVLFAVGVMSLPWVAALTLFVLLEKIGPAGTVVARAGGGAMIVAGFVQ
jgi:predicted metal-binding membrane protein